MSKKLKIKNFIAVCFSILLGLLLSSYYIIPLNSEIKYFYYGLIKNHIDQGSFLSFVNYFDPRWYYFTKSEIATRGHLVQFGLIETITLIIGFLYLLYAKLIKKSKENIQILYFALTMTALLIFFTTPYSGIFFQKLFFLNNLQFPWRFLSGLIIFPPIIAAFLFDKFPKKIILILVIFIVAVFYFPQLYGKNFILYPNQVYYFNPINIHSVLLNTIWTGTTEKYPNRNPQGQIIEGQGKIITETLKNSSRKYVIDAQTPLRMVDHTFYFPGWALFIDGVKTDIEFQNPDYRGVITYQVPQGKHAVSLIFEDTKIRLLGKILSGASLILLIALFFLRNKIAKIFKF